jgi:hypothetical protein
MHFVYSFCNGNSTAALLEYQHRYLHHSIPHHTIFDTMYRILKQTGLFPQATAEREQWHGEGSILDAVQRSPCTRIRWISTMTGRTQKQVCRIFHPDGSNPYHLQKSATPSTGSLTKTVYDSVHGHNYSFQFCLTFSPCKAQFTKDGIKNKKNSHCWAQENPHQIIQCHFQQWFSVQVWCGVLGHTSTAVHVIERRLTALSYRYFLENKLLLYIEDVPLAPCRQICIWHDTAPPRFGRKVNRMFKWTLWRKTEWKKQTSDVACLFTQPEPIRFHSVGLHEVKSVWQQ